MLIGSYIFIRLWTLVLRHSRGFYLVGADCSPSVWGCE
uniref:Uncharacterized protein n=1 Tax=Arundo donax TaxID=35708 RepID=A0A0A9FC60_ARUDO